jgi:RNA recognition motif-containing protein
MEKKLYVGGLPYTTTEESLKAAFAQAGTVESASVIMDRATGRSKGFGFVEMATPEEAQAAIQMWDGKDLEGRTIRVNIARPKTEGPRRDGGFNRGGGGRGRW